MPQAIIADSFLFCRECRGRILSITSGREERMLELPTCSMPVMRSRDVHGCYARWCRCRGACACWLVGWSCRASLRCVVYLAAHISDDCRSLYSQLLGVFSPWIPHTPGLTLNSPRSSERMLPTTITCRPCHQRAEAVGSSTMGSNRPEQGEGRASSIFWSY